jgi:hypothetical protein
LAGAKNMSKKDKLTKQRSSRAQLSIHYYLKHKGIKFSTSPPSKAELGAYIVLQNPAKYVHENLDALLIEYNDTIVKPFLIDRGVTARQLVHPPDKKRPKKPKYKSSFTNGYPPSFYTSDAWRALRYDAFKIHGRR